MKVKKKIGFSTISQQIKQHYNNSGLTSKNETFKIHLYIEQLL